MALRTTNVNGSISEKKRKKKQIVHSFEKANNKQISIRRCGRYVRRDKAITVTNLGRPLNTRVLHNVAMIGKNKKKVYVFIPTMHVTITEDSVDEVNRRRTVRPQSHVGYKLHRL